VSSTNGPSSKSELFYVRIPDGQEFGPADHLTILDWEKQGRVNDTCQIRLAESGELIDYAFWKSQRVELRVPASVNIFGEHIGRVERPANQSAITPKSRANTVLVLSLCSWLLCLSFVGAPVCALLAIGFGATELGRIKRGEVETNQQTIVWTGIAIASANLLFVLIFMMYGLIAAIVP